MSENNIVILGAGFAGLRVALDLSKRFHELGQRKIILIDKELVHTYTPLLYEVATGWFDKETKECEGILRQGTCVILENLLHIAAHRHIDFRCGEARGIDFEKKEINLAGGKIIDFEYLVLALGAETNFFNIPGLRENAFTLKSVSDALKIRNKIKELSRKRQKISIIIGGGGATGVELGAEMTCFCQKIKGVNFSITVAEAGDRLLSFLSEKQSAFALTRLKKLGVRVLLNTFIKKVHDSVVALESGREKIELAGDVVIWAGGIKANSFLQTLDLPLDKKGRVEVKDTFEVKGKKKIFALGDCAFLPDKNGAPVPALAQAAIKEAIVAARNIIRDIRGQEKIAYAFPRMDTVIPLGGKYALAVVAGRTIKGFAAWILRRAADLRYFLSILPWHEAWKIWWRGARVYIQND